MARASLSPRIAAASILLLAVAARRAGAAPIPVRAESGSPHPETRLAKGKFLVATRSLRDPTFAESVILLVDYDENGALGVVVNRPTDLPLNSALPDVKELKRRKDRVHLGGPVARDRMVLLLRASKAPPDSVKIFDTVYASGSIEALRDGVAHGSSVRAYAGYAGWGAGQLEVEVQRGDWLVGPADSKAIFDEPAENVWQHLLDRFTGDWAAAPAADHALLAAR